MRIVTAGEARRTSPPASVLQASGFRGDVTAFRLNATVVSQPGSEPPFRRNTAERVYRIEAAHNPEVAGSNPAPATRKAPETGAFLVLAAPCRSVLLPHLLPGDAEHTHFRLVSRAEEQHLRRMDVTVGDRALAVARRRLDVRVRIAGDAQSARASAIRRRTHCAELRTVIRAIADVLRDAVCKRRRRKEV
jgi:hypothetical protein